MEVARQRQVQAEYETHCFCIRTRRVKRIEPHENESDQRQPVEVAEKVKPKMTKSYRLDELENDIKKRRLKNKPQNLHV